VHDVAHLLHGPAQLLHLLLHFAVFRNYPLDEVFVEVHELVEVLHLPFQFVLVGKHSTVGLGCHYHFCFLCIAQILSWNRLPIHVGHHGEGGILQEVEGGRQPCPARAVEAAALVQVKVAFAAFNKLLFVNDLLSEGPVLLEVAHCHDEGGEVEVAAEAFLFEGVRVDLAIVDEAEAQRAQFWVNFAQLNSSDGFPRVVSLLFIEKEVVLLLKERVLLLALDGIDKPSLLLEEEAGQRIELDLVPAHGVQVDRIAWALRLEKSNQSHFLILALGVGA